MRNSVDEAIAAAEALRERGVDAMLHHARFAMCDRLANEARVLATFGKQATDRGGKVVVGTRVLEQSLDVDFDVMVSDLAPMGALVQRAGRLWRHMALRPALSRPVAGPRLHVLSPDPDEVRDARWSHDLLGLGWFVYPPPVQWRTAHALFDAGTIDAPDGLRDLIEAVEDGGDLPKPLLDAEADSLKALTGKCTLGQQNTLDPLCDYRSATGIASDETFPTRIGPKQVTLVLVNRRDDSTLAPYAGGEVDDARAWALSEVSMSETRWERSGGVDQSAPEIAAVQRDWPTWKDRRHFVCPVGKNGVIVPDVVYDRKASLVTGAP